MFSVCLFYITYGKKKRDANFTSQEKLFLAELIQQHLESRDTNSLAEKRRAWELITDEYNCNGFVVKRNTVTLKRAWDNMKSAVRKWQAAESEKEQSKQKPEEIINIASQAVPEMCTSVLNTSDKNDRIENNPVDIIKTEFCNENYEVILDKSSRDCHDGSDSNNNCEEQNHHQPPSACKNDFDYIKQEAALRLKHFKEKTKLKMQILQVQLEAEEAKKRAAELEERRNKILLDIAKSQMYEINRLNHS